MILGQKTANVIKVGKNSLAVYVPTSWFEGDYSNVRLRIYGINAPSSEMVTYHVRPVRMHDTADASCRIAVRSLDGFKPGDRVVVSIERDDDAKDPGRKIKSTDQIDSEE